MVRRGSDNVATPSANEDPGSDRARYDPGVESPDDPSSSGSGDLENRVEILEREVARLREQAALAGSDAAAARTLAAGADRDVSEVRAELRAHTTVLNALRETQVEQGQRIDALRETQIEQGQRMTDGFARLSEGMQEIVGLLRRDEGSG